MKPLPHEGAGAIGGPGAPAVPGTVPFGTPALLFSRTTADAALAVLAYATNQAIAGQVTFVHLVGGFAHAQARELSTTGAQAVPAGVLRDAVVAVADIEERFADSLIDAANQYGRSFAHIAFAFPVPSHVAH